MLNDLYFVMWLGCNFSNVLLLISGCAGVVLLYVYG